SRPRGAAVGRASNVNRVRGVAAGVVGPGDIDGSAVGWIDRDGKVGTHPFLSEKMAILPWYDDSRHGYAGSAKRSEPTAAPVIIATDHHVYVGKREVGSPIEICCIHTAARVNRGPNRRAVLTHRGSVLKSKGGEARRRRRRRRIERGIDGRRSRTCVEI